MKISNLSYSVAIFLLYNSSERKLVVRLWLKRRRCNLPTPLHILWNILQSPKYFGIHHCFRNFMNSPSLWDHSLRRIFSRNGLTHSLIIPERSFFIFHLPSRATAQTFLSSNFRTVPNAGSFRRAESEENIQSILFQNRK